MNITQAMEHLKDWIQPNGELFSSYEYTRWIVGSNNIQLDGWFSADDLEAIAVYMRSTYLAVLPPQHPLPK